MGIMAVFFVVCVSDNCYNQIILPSVRSGARSGVRSARAGARVPAALSRPHARRDARPGQSGAPQAWGASAPAGRAGARVPRPLEAVGRGGAGLARVQHGAAAHQLAWAGHLGPGARSRGHGLAWAGGDVWAALTEWRGAGRGTVWARAGAELTGAWGEPGLATRLPVRILDCPGVGGGPGVGVRGGLSADRDAAVGVTLVPEAGLARGHAGVHSTGNLPSHWARTEVKVDLVLVKWNRGLWEVVRRGASALASVATGGVVVHYHNGGPVYLTAGRPGLAPGFWPPEGGPVVDVVDRHHGAAPRLPILGVGQGPGVVPVPLGSPLDGVVALVARPLALLAALPALAPGAGLVPELAARVTRGSTGAGHRAWRERG